MIELGKVNRILFLGIGGIGMSALARYFLEKNIEIYGYDRTESDLTKDLIQAGMRITYEDNLEFTAHNFDFVIYTPAIPKDSNLYNYYLNNSTPMMKRAEALGVITKDKKTIAVCGSHGKTTVSTMIAFLLKECGVDVSAFLGGISVNYQSNYIYGSSDYVVVEADEFDKSFLKLYPDYIILTSIDTDHLDIYGSREHIVATFQEFLDLLPDTGILIYSENVKDAVHVKGQSQKYGINEGRVHASNIEIFPRCSTFNVNRGGVKYTLNYNGRHNIENALAAISIGKILGLEEERMSAALKKFRGIKRRFEVLLEKENFVWIDDYAHHPTEIEALIGSVREIFPGRTILSIFQPHLFSRTKDLANDFAKALDMSDEVILLPIYPARELPLEGVTSDLISNKMHKPCQVVDKEDLPEVIKSRPCNVILTIGAGDISTLIPEIKMILND